MMPSSFLPSFVTFSNYMRPEPDYRFGLMSEVGKRVVSRRLTAEALLCLLQHKIQRWQWQHLLVTAVSASAGDVLHCHQSPCPLRALPRPPGYSVESLSPSILFCQSYVLTLAGQGSAALHPSALPW